MKKTTLIAAALILSLIMAISTASFAAEEATTTQAAPQVATTYSIPKFLVSYSYYHYDLQGANTSNTRIYGFNNATADVQLVTATWLYSSKWTFTTLVPYMKNMMETTYFGSLKLTDYTEGLGDVRFMATTPVITSLNHLWMADVSVTAPTGSVDERYSSHPAQKASYNMQLGSGTPDLIVGTTYTYSLPRWVNSARAEAVVRGGRNSSGWALGNEFNTKVSSKYIVSKYFDVGVAGSYKARDQVQGRDNKYEIANNLPQGDAHQYYHAPQISWDTQVVAKLQSPSYHSMTAALEGGVPFWRGAINKDDIRLDMPYWVSASVNGTF